MRYFVTFRDFGRKSAVLEFSTIEIPHKKAFEVVVFYFATSLKRLCYQLFSTNEIILPMKYIDFIVFENYSFPKDHRFCRHN